MTAGFWGLPVGVTAPRHAEMLRELLGDVIGMNVDDALRMIKNCGFTTRAMSVDGIVPANLDRSFDSGRISLVIDREHVRGAQVG